MTIFLKRLFLLFFIIIACLFMVYLMIPETAHAHTTGLLGTQQQAATPIATIAPTTVSTVTPIPTATATAMPSPSPTATATPTPIPPPVATTEPSPSPTATATPTPIPTSVVPPTTPPGGGNTTTNSSHTALNYVIFTMGSVGVLMVVVGVILYFVYSRPV